MTKVYPVGADISGDVAAVYGGAGIINLRGAVSLLSEKGF